MKYAAYLVSTLGIILHLYLTFFHTTAGSINYLIVPAMNLIPYLACMIVLLSSARPILPLCAATILLLFDLYLFSGYIFSTKTYRYLVIESYFIIFKTAVIVPIGCLIGYVIDKVMKPALKN
jgi:hypothetical protein